MSAYEPPPPPEARGLRLSDIVRRRPAADPDDEELAFPAAGGDRDAASRPAAARSERESEDASWRSELRERRQRGREAGRADQERRVEESRRAREARRAGRREEAAPEPGRTGGGDTARPVQAERDDHAGRGGRPTTRPTRPRPEQTSGAKAEHADKTSAAEATGQRAPVRHVMKPRDPGRHGVPTAPAAPAKRTAPWRKPAAATGAAAASGEAGTAPAGGIRSRFVRRDPSTGTGADSPRNTGRSPASGDQAPPVVVNGASGGWMPGFGMFGRLDLVMLIPAGIAAYYGAGLLVSCADEAGGRAAFALWLMMGFWIVIVSAKWPLLRLMRWAWVLAGLMAGASIPIGGG